MKEQIEEILDEYIWGNTYNSTFYSPKTDKQAEYCNDYCCTVRDEETIKKYVINYEF